MTLLVVAAILACVAALACLPIQVGATVEWNDTREIRGTVTWAWGLLSLSIDQSKQIALSVFGYRKNLKLEASRKSGGDSDSERPKSKRSKKNFGGLMREHVLGEWRTWIDISLRLMRTLHWRGTVEGTVGLDDPADTALLATVMNVAPLVSGPHLELNLVPDYLQGSMAISAEARMRVIPAEVLSVLVRQLLRAPVRRLLWSSLRK